MPAENVNIQESDESVDSSPGESTDETQIASNDTELAPAEGDSEAAPTAPYDYYNPDTWGDKQPKDVMKEVQTYNNQISTRKAELEREVAKKAEEQQQWETWAKQVIANPEAYKNIRRQYGYQDEVTQAQTDGPPKLALNLNENATLDDLEKQLATHFEQRDQYWASRYDSELAKRDKMYEERIARSTQPVAQMKWDAAKESVRNKLGSAYAKVEDGVLSQAVNGPLKALYGTMPDDVFLETVYKAAYADQYAESILASKQAEAIKRKASSTAKPSTKQSSANAGKLTGVDAALERLKAKGF